MTNRLSSVPPEILEKIKKCLAMTRSNWENEAATALRLANELMEKYGLSRAEIEIDQDTGQLKQDHVKEFYTKAFAMAPWEKNLVRVVMYLLPVEPLFIPVNNHRQHKVMFLGAEGDAALAVEVYYLLRKELIALSREEDEGLSQRSWLLGCVDTIRERAYDLNYQRKKAVNSGVNSSQSKALVVAKQTQLAEIMKKRFDTKPMRRPSTSYDPDAYSRGQEAGRNVNIAFGSHLPKKEGL